ncbi:hypothetical protein R1sor_013578 [Riccia sorocarpa]|uniref:Uncharacterized protein n=1 Tax=Riccia sorocarpa TaxID=122646 RepID=A0ABD3H9T7_9MARC
MAPDKGQAEDKSESDNIYNYWWRELGENDLEYTRILRKLRPERKAFLRRIGGKLISDEKVVTTCREIDEMGLRRLTPFFQGDRGRRLRAKLLVAIGKCKTLIEFDNRYLEDLDLQPKEWEVLLKSMNRNCQLEKIVWDLEVVPAGSSRNIGELVKGAGNLKTFEVRSSEYNEQGIAETFPLELAAIASSLEGHKHATLAKFVAGPVHDLTNDIVKIISSAPHLSDVELYGPCSMDETTKVVLCAALKECSDLRRVHLTESSEGILEVLTKVYGQLFSDPQVSVLESLELKVPRGLAGLACLASSNICNLEIYLLNPIEHLCSLEEWQRVGRSLVKHPTFRVFKIKIEFSDVEREAYGKLGKELAELWKASRKSPLLDIGVYIGSIMLDTDLVFLQDALKDTYLKEIVLYGEINPQQLKSFAEVVGANTSVRFLQLFHLKVDGAEWSPTVLEDSWGHFFHHLRENTSIRTLDFLSAKGLNDEIFRDLMDLLQVNFILRKVKLGGTQWGRDGKSALVEAALERNAKLAGYFSVLGAAQLSFDGAKAGRIFLCGLPFAGKTQLKVTMMECFGKASTSESLKETMVRWIPETVTRWVPGLRRTEGIEVELFYDKEAMTISIWDFAGQQIFRPLQNILFPKLSQACVFLFVFNPFNVDDEKITGLKENVHDAFAEELRNWLRFIVSNTQITGRIRAQVIVVITHKDVLEKCNDYFGEISISGLENVVKALQREFQDVVELCPQSSGQEGKLVYHINATLKQDIEPITNLVISCMRDVLSRKSPKVPRVCSELVSLLLKRPRDVQTKPLWPCINLYEFCSTNSELLSHIDVTEKERGKVLHAIASYIHDAGAVCMTPRALVEHVGNADEDCKKLAVVDLNWLTQNLLGQLITLGHPTETMKGASIRRFGQVKVDADGFLNIQQLDKVLHCVLSQNKDKEVDISMVKELLLELDLCYCLEHGMQTERYFFMPILLGEESRGTNSFVSLLSSEQVICRPLSWEVKSPQGSSYFGYRIQCRDPKRTALSPAFYPRYQIHLRKRMGATLGVKDENFVFGRSHVEIRVDGYCIFVETDVSSENHIDVLVQFCKPDSRDRIIEFTRRQLVQDLFEFCASEKGCPGVQLVVAIIRTKCVEDLTPKQLRSTSQVVLAEDLKDIFKKQLKTCLESKVGLVTQVLSVRKLNDLYERGCQDNLQIGEFLDALEFSLDLLSSEEVREIVQTVWGDHKKFWPQGVLEVKGGPYQQLPGTSKVS